MGKKSKSKSKQNKSKKTKNVPNIENDEVSLDEVETSVIQDAVADDEVQNSEDVVTSDETKTESEFTLEYNLLLELRDEEKKIRQEREEYLRDFMKEHEKKMKEFSGVLKKNKKEQDNSIKKIKKLHSTEVKKASKEKRKRNGKATGGFTTEKKVPEKLRLWLGLEEGVKLTRPNVFHLMSEKFKEQGLKNGQEVVLDKVNAKQLGKPNKYKIEWSKQQTFLASFYNEEKSKEVTV
tara:strand:+ start:127 stop:834 length:708 start_codon:yes stop_codon:yes gene_type:complete